MDFAKIKKKFNKPYAVPAVFFLLILIPMHLMFPIFGDDIHLMNVSRTYGLIERLIVQYNIWSSRLLIEGVMFVVGLRWVLFLICNIIAYILLYVFMVKTFMVEIDKRGSWFCLFMILLLPLVLLSTAGHMATSMMYLWTSTAAIIAGYGMKKAIIKQKKIRWWEYPLYLVALLFAGNLETLAVLLLGIVLFLIAYTLLVEKRVVKYLFFQLVIILGMLIFILTTPGNAARSATEVSVWFPGYMMLGFFDRIQLGYAFTLTNFVFTTNIVFTTFCALLFIAVFLQYKEKAFRIIAAIPLGMSLMFGMMPNIVPVHGITALSQFGRSNQLVVNVANVARINFYLAIIILGIVVLCIFASLYICYYNNKKYAWFTIVLILLGLATAIALGLSPSIFVTNTRAHTYAFFSFIIVSILLYQKIRDMNFKYEKVLYGTVGFLGIYSVMGYISALIMN